MKHFDSHTTSLTKTSLLRGSKSASQPHSTVTVFIEHHLKRTSIILSVAGHTVSQLIGQALEEYNLMEGTHLSPMTEKWELYACKKNSKAYSDYPSLEPSQKIGMTGFTYFYLCHQSQFSRSSSQSSTKIKTTFESSQKQEIKAKQMKSCLCFRL